MNQKLDVRAAIAHLGLEYGSEEYKRAYRREYARLKGPNWQRDRMKKFREKKKEAIREYKREYDKEWRRENAEKLRAGQAERRRQHPLFGIWAEVRRRDKSPSELEALIARLGGLVDDRDQASQPERD